MKTLSHIQDELLLKDSIQEIREKIHERGDLPYASVEKQLDILDQLAKSSIGQFLIAYKEINGFWTQYAVDHPKTTRLTGLNPEGNPFSEIERFILDRAPVVIATQERYQIFKQLLQDRVSENAHLASVPCGLMGCLLELDYSNVSHVTLTGIDIDQESLDLAFAYAQKRHLHEKCHLYKEDAWEMKQDGRFDTLVSNGLSIYVSDENRLRELYRSFFRSLRSGGVCISSYLSPPPIPGLETEWNMQHINPQNALMQKLVFGDIIGTRWQCFRSEKMTRQLLEDAGFIIQEVIRDQGGVFPTVVAKKP